jgi:hypothetical protein
VLDFILVRALFVLIFGVTAAYFRPADTPLWVGAIEGVAIAGIAIFLETRIARVSLKRLIGAAAAQYFIDFAVYPEIKSVLFLVPIAGWTTQYSHLLISKRASSDFSSAFRLLAVASRIR